MNITSTRLNIHSDHRHGKIHIPDGSWSKTDTLLTVMAGVFVLAIAVIVYIDIL